MTASKNILIDVAPLGPPPWPTLDPFLFCVHHQDAYPPGNENVEPVASLDGRAIGQDFSGKDGWSMYHSDRVPGFPQHPHRGFETVTVARSGFIDHSDSLGASARFGDGDLQWMTAGRGIVHSEMFPLLRNDADNPTELFQIWLNLPARRKMVDPYFSMFWDHQIPRLTTADPDGRETTVVTYCGALPGAGDPANQPLSPPPDSWAADPSHDVSIWTIKMEPDAKWTLPTASTGCNRRLYYFAGDTSEFEGEEHASGHALTLAPENSVQIRNGSEESEFLLLQGQPIGEPVAHYGPFVMTDEEELRAAFADYRATGFGGWPWPSDGPAHAREADRFARHPDGRIEKA